MKTRILTLLAVLFTFADVAASAPIVFRLGADPVQDYLAEDVGPYPGTLTNTNVQGFFCLDETLGSTFETRYTGTEAVPFTPQEQEAVFLASLAVQLGHNSDGPISFAIWQIMGTMGNHPEDPSAQQYVAMANYALAQELICSDLLSQALIFTSSDSTVQRFIAAAPDAFDINAALVAMNAEAVPTPEPSTGTTALLCGVLLLLRHLLGMRSEEQ